MVLNHHGGEIKEKIKYDFSVNVNPLGMPYYVKNAIVDGIDMLCEYPDRCYVNLKNSIAEYEGIKPDQILCGNGASELIMAICAFVSNKKMLNYSDGNGLKRQSRISALIQSPTFSGYERAIKAYGGDAVYYRNYDEVISFIEDNTENLGIDIIFICNPNNPTGEVINKARLAHLMDIAKKKNIFVVLDECFIDFTHEESLVSQNSYDNLIVLKAFTKFYALAGVRLGYICMAKEVCERISDFLPEWNVSTVAQLAGVAAISDKKRASKWKEDTIHLIDEERSYLTKELIELGFEVSDSKANYLLCKSEDSKLWEKLRAIGILVRDCGNFSGLNSSYIRICVSTHEKNEILISAIKGLIRG